MWSIIKAVLIKFGMLRGLFAVLGSLAAIVPIALALVKLVGWPLLLVMFVLGIPLLLVLLLFGFPLIAVLGIAGTVLATTFTVITVGIMVLKFLFFVALPIYVAWRVAKWAFGRGRGGEKPRTDVPSSAETSP